MIKRVFLSVWFLGLLIAVPVILLLPEFFNKYRVKLVLQETAAQQGVYRIYFRDIDKTGIAQKIYAFPNRANQLACQYFGDKGGMINQINFKYNYAPTAPFLFFGDADNNGVREFYGFTQNQDSLYLNWIEPAHPLLNNSQSVFITKLGTVSKDLFDFSVSRFTVMDLDNDGNNEVVFSIVAGHSRFPRMMVIFHPETGELLKSKDIGINPYNVSFYDVNNDGKIEILASSIAGYNLVDSVNNRIIDNRPYLLAYDTDLNLLWPPIPFSSGINNSTQILVNNPNYREILVFQYNRSLATEKMIGIYKVDFNGNVKDSVFLKDYGKRFNFQVFLYNDLFFLFTGDKMVMIDNRLNVVGEKNIDISAKMFRNEMFVNECPEVATVDLHEEKAYIYTENFAHRVEIKYSGEKIENVILNVRGNEYFMIQTDSNEYTYHFEKNWKYYFKFPGYFLIYLLSVSFIWLIQRIREKQLNERYELQTQLRDLEIKYLRMQMDPHFMFNIFNSIALLLKNGARDEAFDAFMKFTRVVRSNFDFSDRFTRQLGEEIEMVRQYLELNKLRFKEKLEFGISIAGNVPMSVLIPKMMLQIHVENALKHGLAKLEKKGTIFIDIVMVKDEIRVTIEDNGIGRKKAAQLNPDSTKQGLKMLQAMIDRLNQQSKTKIAQEITDLTDDNQNPTGTRVDIRVPDNMKEAGSV